MKRFYLSGAMEYAPDEGKGWRYEVADFIKKELKAEVFNPSEEGPRLLNPVSVEEFRALKFSHKKRYVQLVRRLIERDLAEIKENTEALICLWDEHASRGGGTHGELTVAYDHNVPVYMVTAVPVAEISGWILGCCTEIFSNFESLFKYLLNKYSKNKEG